MNSKKPVLQKLEQFYVHIQSKRRNQSMQLQLGNEFQQVKVKDLNDKYHVKIFTTSLRGGKAFATE